MSMSTLDIDPTQSTAPIVVTQQDRVKSPIMKNPGYSHLHCPTELHRSCFCVRFIAEHTRMLEDSVKVKEDWKYVAMVLDRLFLWIFTLAVLAGTAGIILQVRFLFMVLFSSMEQNGKWNIIFNRYFYFPGSNAI